MKNAITWFEIPTTQLDRAQAFYEAVLGQPLRRENMGPSEGAVFAYDGAADGVGGALMMGPTAPQVSGGGTLVHLDASPSLDAALERVVAHAGTDNGAPGERPYHPGYYAAFVLDLDVNNIEAVVNGEAQRSAPSLKVTF